ncbi:MAG: hypothetical protein JXA01_00700 [Dehalococcoidia bacterium]|nr:hypothetical protein [Dehalococcoidia bacterium]
MEWQVIVALVVAVPLILSPVVLVWHLNMGGIFAAYVNQMKAKQPVQEKSSEIAMEAR